MKKNLLILTFFCSILIFSSLAFGQSGIQVYVNRDKVDFPDASPFITNGRTLVPVRFVAESLGAKVEWSQATAEVTILKDSEKIVLKIGEKKATVGSKVFELDTNAVIKDSRTFVPLRFISETLDANVEWEASTSTVFINTDGKAKVVIKPIEEVIKNKEVIHADIVKKAIFIDKDKYNFELLNFDDKLFIQSNALTFKMVFIKDGKIINQISPMPSLDKVYYPIDFEIKDIDFLGIYTFSKDTMEIVENPFK